MNVWAMNNNNNIYCRNAAGCTDKSRKQINNTVQQDQKCGTRRMKLKIHRSLGTKKYKYEI